MTRIESINVIILIRSRFLAGFCTIELTNIYEIRFRRYLKITGFSELRCFQILRNISILHSHNPSYWNPSYCNILNVWMIFYLNQTSFSKNRT